MTANEPSAAVCQFCGENDRDLLRRAVLVRPAIVQLIQSQHGKWDADGWLCLSDLQQFQHQYVRSLLEDEKREVTAIEMEVLNGLKEHEILARNPDVDSDADRTFGQRLADRIATFGGSWMFIVVFSTILVGWMVINTVILVSKPFDPFPFILLNLFLSAIAAFQAPVIMMSQNRQESRDRLRAMHDYQVNLKAELEIRQLHQKIDHLLSNQWERLVEIQEVQIELMNELRDRSK